MYLTDERSKLLNKRTPVLRKLIGEKVYYLENADIDKSGRGYYFPRCGIIEDVRGRNVFFNDGRSFYLPDVREMVLYYDYIPQ